MIQISLTVHMTTLQGNFGQLVLNHNLYVHVNMDPVHFIYISQGESFWKFSLTVFKKSYLGGGRARKKYDR